MTRLCSLLAVFVLLAACQFKMPDRPLMGGNVTDGRTTTGPLGTESQETANEVPAAVDMTDVRPLADSLLIPLTRYAYRVWYSDRHRLPMAVSWCLTADHTYGDYKRDGLKFREDTDIAGVRATTYDYIQSGYDRGHLCPSADNKWSQTAQEQSFLMTNICPQVHALNDGDWSTLEQTCRSWARSYGTIYIVCGPILQGSRHKTIGRSKVTVPEAFYKVVLRAGDECAAIGFVYQNKGGSQPMERAVRTVDEIEEMTGMDFFHALPDHIEERVEAVADLSDWLPSQR